MEISPRELRDIEIHSAVRGYDRDEVNELLERAAVTIESTSERLTQVQERLSSAQAEAGRTRETEDILHRTLLLAQRAADEAVAEATTKSRSMLDEAEISARRLVADAEADARRKGEAERRRLEEEILELAGRRDALLADVEALTRFEAEYRERMVRALEADLFALRSRPTTAPGARPEPTDVELPAHEDVQPAAVVADTPAEPIVNTPAPAPIPTPAAALVDESTPDEDLHATRDLDVRSLFGDGATAAAPAEQQPAPVVAAAPPIDLSASDATDADVLDDDAFFATLRDAVHDDAPLGPRDENDITDNHQFFDQDADRGSFRDVFKRRR